MKVMLILAALTVLVAGYVTTVGVSTPTQARGGSAHGGTDSSGR